MERVRLPSRAPLPGNESKMIPFAISAQVPAVCSSPRPKSLATTARNKARRLTRTLGAESTSKCSCVRDYFLRAAANQFVPSRHQARPRLENSLQERNKP